MPVNFLGCAICLTSGLLSTRSKVIKYKFVKKISYKIIEIMTRKSDKNQLELGKLVGLRPQIYILSSSGPK